MLSTATRHRRDFIGIWSCVHSAPKRYHCRRRSVAFWRARLSPMSTFPVSIALALTGLRCVLTIR